jgi:hypothetical protein
MRILAGFVYQRTHAKEWDAGSLKENRSHYGPNGVLASVSPGGTMQLSPALLDRIPGLIATLVINTRGRAA